MNLIEYQKETWRTCPDLGNEATNLAHMVLGICSEYSEFSNSLSNGDSVNTSEEIADKFWYISNYCNFRNYSLNDLWNQKNNIKKTISMTNNSIDDYFYYLAELQDLVKKNLAYGKEIDKQIETATISSLLIMLERLWIDFEFNLEKALKNNIDKLRKRFPDKFDKDKAINRNLEAERKELEK